MIFSVGGDTQLAWIFEHGFKLLSGFLHWLSCALLISVSTPPLGVIDYLDCLLFFHFLRQLCLGFPTRRLPEPDMFIRILGQVNGKQFPLQYGNSWGCTKSCLHSLKSDCYLCTCQFISQLFLIKFDSMYSCSMRLPFLLQGSLHS